MGRARSLDRLLFTSGTKIGRMLYAGSNLDKAREVYPAAVKHRPRIRLTIRQRTRVLQQWPAPR